MYERRVEGEIEGLRGERKRQRDRQRERAGRGNGKRDLGKRSILVCVHIHVCTMCILAAYYLCSVYG